MATSGSGTMTPISAPPVGVGGEAPGVQPTKLPIARYAQIMRLNAPHFHQMNAAKAPMSTDGCDDLWDQDDRATLAMTIAEAEHMIEQELGTFLVPTYVTNEDIRIGRVRADWWNAEFATRWKNVWAFGTEQLTALGEDAPVTYSDADNDPYSREELATIGQAGLYDYLPACDDECDVAVFFRVADGAWDAASPWFEIRPLRVDIDSATVMYVKGESSQFIQPPLWALTRADCVGGTDWRWDFDLDNLVSQVDVYCRTTDQETPVTIYWDGVCTCASPCAHTTQAACALTTDWGRGHFAPRAATWNGTSHVYTSPTYATQPVKIRINYLAGVARDPIHCRMNSLLERAVVKLTNALLPEPPCGYCDMAERIWKQDRKNVDPLTVESAGLPWDIYSQGALEAWRIVKRFQARGALRGGSVRGG